MWRTFQEEWGRLLAPHVDGARLDRTSFRNALSSPKIWDLLAKLPGLPGGSSLTLLKEHLARDAARERMLLDLVTHADESADPGWDFEGHVVTGEGACGYLIREARGGELLEKCELAPLVNESIRVVVQRPSVPWPLFVIDRWSNGTLSIAWPYELPVDELVSQLPRLAQSVTQARPGDASELSFFTDGEVTVKKGAMAQCETELVERLGSGQVDFVEFSVGQVTVFCDIEPLLDRELQLGVISPLADVRRGTSLAGLAAAISATSTVPLDERFCERAIRSVLDRFSSAFPE
jgi:hypothetical protein